MTSWLTYCCPSIEGLLLAQFILEFKTLARHEETFISISQCIQD